MPSVRRGQGLACRARGCGSTGASQLRTLLAAPKSPPLTLQRPRPGPTGACRRPMSALCGVLGGGRAGKPGACANSWGPVLAAVRITHRGVHAVELRASASCSLAPRDLRAEMSCLLERLRRVGPPQGISRDAWRLMFRLLWPKHDHRRPIVDSESAGLEPRPGAPRHSRGGAGFVRVVSTSESKKNSRNRTVVAPPSASCTISSRHAVASSALRRGRHERVVALERVGEG